ncbi:chemotaxis protein CheB [Aquimarina sp. M1]
MSKDLRIFVIGASAGGLKAVKTILVGIPQGLNAAFLVVVHNTFKSSNSFFKVLANKINLEIKEAENHLLIEPDTVYVARPNHHLFVKNDNKIVLSKGPRENLFRPSIDVLFRSAAVAFKNRCVGILLTGRLNDGTNGLVAIQKCGGLTIIQNPDTAEFGDMPLFAKSTIDIDYIVNLEDMAGVLQKITEEEIPVEKEIPLSIIKENDIAMRFKSQVGLQKELGQQVPLSCAECGGPLWKMADSDPERYRCHVGHSFTQEALEQSQEASLEEALWVSIRTLEEKKTLLRRMADEYDRKKMTSLSASYANKIEEVTEHITNIKAVLQLND